MFFDVLFMCVCKFLADLQWALCCASLPRRDSANFSTAFGNLPQSGSPQRSGHIASPAKPPPTTSAILPNSDPPRVLATPGCTQWQVPHPPPAHPRPARQPPPPLSKYTDPYPIVFLQIGGAAFQNIKNGSILVCKATACKPIRSRHGVGADKGKKIIYSGLCGNNLQINLHLP